MRAIVRVLLGGSFALGVAAVALVILTGWADGAHADPPADPTVAPAPPAVTPPRAPPAPSPSAPERPSAPTPPSLPQLPSPAAPTPPPAPEAGLAGPGTGPPPVTTLPRATPIGSAPALSPLPDLPAIDPAGITSPVGPLPEVPALTPPDAALPPLPSLADAPLPDAHLPQPQLPEPPLPGPASDPTGAGVVPESPPTTAGPPGLASTARPPKTAGASAPRWDDTGGIVAVVDGRSLVARAPPTGAPTSPCAGSGTLQPSRGDPARCAPPGPDLATRRAALVADARSYASTLLLDPVLRPD